MNRWKSILPLILLIIFPLFAAAPASAQSRLTEPVVPPVLPVDGQVILSPTTKILTDAELQIYIPPELPCPSPAIWIPPELPCPGPAIYIPPELPCASPVLIPPPPELPVPFFYIPPELPCLIPPPPELPCATRTVTDARCPVFIPPPPELPCLIPPPPELPCSYNPAELPCDKVGCQVLRFRGTTPLLSSLKPGDVIVSGVTAKTPLGMLRKVLLINQNDQGLFSIVVGPATLENAVLQGSVQHSGSLLNRRFVAYSGKGPAIQQVPGKPSLPFSFEAANARGQKVRFSGSITFGSVAGMNYSVTLGLKYIRPTSDGVGDDATLGLKYIRPTSDGVGDDATLGLKYIRPTSDGVGDDATLGLKYIRPTSDGVGDDATLGLKYIKPVSDGVGDDVTLGLKYIRPTSDGVGDDVTLGLRYDRIGYGATTDVKLIADSIVAEGDVEFNREFEAGRFFFEPVTIMMGRLPIVVAPELAVFVAAEGRVYAGMKARLEEGAIVTLGANYQDGQWTPVRTYSTMYSFSEPDVGGKAKFILSVKPQLSFKFYGISGPTTALQLRAITAIDDTQSPWWQLYGELKGFLSFPTGVLGCLPSKPLWPLIDWAQLVTTASGPFPLFPTISGAVVDWYGTPVGGVQMIFSPGTTVTTDARGFYINKVPAGWSGTVTPYRVGSDFGPRSRTYTNVRANLTNQNYIMTQGSIQPQ
ncbi:MAG: hypothetical protein HPY67_04400 [Syntrophaceae bacterium]|nr:hypothetical protein [Syntrophaceae bacterium]